MRAEGSSPPPPESLLNPGVSTSTLLNGSSVPITATAPSRKRKRPAHGAAPSPAPSDQASNAGANHNTSDLLGTSRADLSSRPILTLSRGPIFVPVSEGSEWFKTEMVGVNRVGYRYVPAGINPPGRAMPCRTIESNPTFFRISWEDRSPFLKVSKDGLSISGSKGFRSARCNAPVREGKWYMEVKILNGGGQHAGEESLREGGHVRLGWGRREASLNAPVGVDGYSYGYRDKTGEKVTLSRPRPYGCPFGTGDVIGMYISLPPRRPPNKKDPLDPAHLKRERIPIDLKGQEVFEILEYPQSKEMMALMDYSGKTSNSASVPSSSKKTTNGKLPERGPTVTTAKPTVTNLRPLPILSDSRIAFFVNGESQGIAFQDIYDYLPLRQTDTQKANSRKRTREGVKEHRENPFDDGTLGYYPFISLFNDASVRLNSGPDFEFPPPPDIDAILDIKHSNSAVDASSANMHIPSQASNTVISDFEMKPIVENSDVKPSINQNDSTPVDSILNYVPPTPNDIKTQQTWQPACKRYAQFIQEEWAFDAVEEGEAKIEFEKLAAADKLEEEKRKQREKKRQQAEARRAADARRRAEEKARKAAEAKAARTSVSDHELALLVSLSSPSPYPVFPPERNQPSPSPLRHSTAFEPEGSVEYEHSPAPTFASYDERKDAQSGYTSENHDNDMDVDHDIEALIASDTPT